MVNYGVVHLRADDNERAQAPSIIKSFPVERPVGVFPVSSTKDAKVLRNGGVSHRVEHAQASPS
jgi:hypothetical protein